jgi:hypothetical protein
MAKNYQSEEAAYRIGEKSLPAIHMTEYIGTKKLNTKE